MNIQELVVDFDSEIFSKAETSDKFTVKMPMIIDGETVEVFGEITKHQILGLIGGSYKFKLSVLSNDVVDKEDFYEKYGTDRADYNKLMECMKVKNESTKKKRLKYFLSCRLGRYVHMAIEEERGRLLGGKTIDSNKERNRLYDISKESLLNKLIDQLYPVLTNGDIDEICKVFNEMREKNRYEYWKKD